MRENAHNSLKEKLKKRDTEKSLITVEKKKELRKWRRIKMENPFSIWIGKAINKYNQSERNYVIEM